MCCYLNVPVVGTEAVQGDPCTDTKEAIGS